MLRKRIAICIFKGVFDVIYEQPKLDKSHSSSSIHELHEVGLSGSGKEEIREACGIRRFDKS
jgi:hypothetical protein